MREWLWPALLLLAACSKEIPVPEQEAVAPPVHTLVAGFDASGPETRSRLSFGDGAAKVLWTAGDSFKMLSYSLENGSLYGRVYTTEDDGVDVASFTASSSLSGRYFVSGYPSSVFSRVGSHDTEDDSFILITPVPSRQPATPGGLAEGVNRAAAWSSSPDADLCFHNLLSVIRFRLDGGIVPDVSSVVFDAGKTVAGEASAYLKDGEPVIDFSHNWTVKLEPRSNTISLDGSFTAAQDYCLALVPVDLPNGFNMYFCNAQGDTLYKRSSKPLTLSRSRITDLGTIRLGDVWHEDKPEVIEYLHQTKGRKKNVICLLAEGYRAEELDKFETRAKSAVDYLFTVEPYKSYKDYFTVYLHRVASHESGAGVTDGNGNLITERDTYFKTSWAADSYSDMKADADRVKTYLKSHCPEIISGECYYSEVPVALLVNDTRYGGICHIYQNGWCFCIVPFAKDGGTSRWSFPSVQAVNVRDDSEGYRETTAAELDEMGRNVGDWKNTFIHEFGGHAYGRLTDEYWKTTTQFTEPGKVTGHNYPVPYRLNVSGYYDEVPWQEDLLDNLDEWIARNPDYSRIGIWQGAQSSLYYRWRSEKTSCMIDNRPYYSTWQRILIVRKILSKAGETFDMQSFIEKDVTLDPIRPVGTALEETSLRHARSRAMMVPEEPMGAPPVVHGEEE